MIDFDKAVQIATRAANRYSQKDGDEFRLTHDATIRKPYGWVFFYELKEQDSGEPDDELVGNSPILVLEKDGTTVFLGTNRPTAELLKEWESRYL